MVSAMAMADNGNAHLSKTMIQAHDTNGVSPLFRHDTLGLSPMLTENMRSKSALGFSLPAPDDSPPRPEDRKNIQGLKIDSPPLTAEETTELFKAKIEDARRDTQQLAGSEEVSEVVKPKLTLDLGKSNVSRLPEAVVDLIKTEVERLSLSHNQIWHIPPRFSECSHLRYLNIRSNVFRELPRGLFKLPLLEILDISRNKIRRISKDISQLTSLRVLSLVHNRIDDLPTEICEMNKLQIIKIADNPLRGKLKSVIELKEKELDLVYSNVTDNEREQALTTEIKRHLRELHPTAQSMDNEAMAAQEEPPLDLPKPLKRVMSSRFPVVPSSTSMDVTPEAVRSSPSQGKPPPIPTRSHFRVTSGQTNTIRKSGMTSTNSSERNRSNSEGTSFQSSGGTRQRRMGLLRKEKSDLDAIDETKVFRQSHLRGFSHGSALRRNGSISSPIIGTSSPSSPRVFTNQFSPASKRFSSLPENKDEKTLTFTSPIIEGAKGLLYSLYQIETQISGLLAAVDGSEAKGLQITMYNASKWLKRLNKTLERAIHVNPEDTETFERAQDSIQQYCADCIMTYKHVISQLQGNVKKIVAGVDPMYIRTLLLLLFGSIVEIKNAMKSFGVEIRGHKRQMSSGNTHSIETIPEEFTTPQQPTRVGTSSRGPSATRLQGRYRSDTTIQLPTLDNMPILQPVQPPQPPGSARLPPSMHHANTHLNGGPPSASSSYTNGSSANSYGVRSRSNSRTNFSGTPNSSFSSIGNTPRSAEVFSLPPTKQAPLRINPMTGMNEIQEETCFEEIYTALTKSYEVALQAVPIARKQFQRCLEAAEEHRQPKEIRDLWLTLVHRCKSCYENSEALQMRLTNMPHKDCNYGMSSMGNGREDPSFWLLCKIFLQSFIDLVTEMREAKELRLLPPEILVVLRPVQKSSRDAGRLIENSPWRQLTDGMGTMPAPTPFSSHGGNPNHQPHVYSNTMNGGMTAYSSGLTQHIQHSLYNHHQISNLPTPISATSSPFLHPPSSAVNNGISGNAVSPTTQLPATPLSAALGPAAQATIPSTPASAYGDRFFKGDVFQRADSLLSMPQAGSVNFLNRR